MPFYKFLIRGTDVRVPDGQRGFWAAKSAFGASEDVARAKVLDWVSRELTVGKSAQNWDSDPPEIEVEKSSPVLLHELFQMPNTGLIFYDTRE
jgi:hypothetical protein